MPAEAISWNARVLLSPRGFHLCLAAYLTVLFVAPMAGPRALAGG